MAAELEVALGAKSELIESSGGVFEVERQGELIYSKKANGRFPEEKEVLKIIKALAAGLPLQKAQQEAVAGGAK